MTKNPDAAPQAFDWLPLDEALRKYPAGHPYWDAAQRPEDRPRWGPDASDYTGTDYENKYPEDKAPPIWATWGKKDTLQRDPEQRVRALCDFFKNFDVAGPQPTVEFMAMVAKPLASVVSIYDEIAARRARLNRLEDVFPAVKTEYERSRRNVEICERVTASSDAAKQKARDICAQALERLERTSAEIDRLKNWIRDGVKYASLDQWLGLVAPSETRGPRPPNLDQIAAISRQVEEAPRGEKASARTKAAQALGYRGRPQTLPSTITKAKKPIRDGFVRNDELVLPINLPYDVSKEVAETATARGESRRQVLRDSVAVSKTGKD